MTRKALVFVCNIAAGTLEEFSNKEYHFTYNAEYQGAPVSLTMPITQPHYIFHHFPPFFEGLLPEGDLLESMLRQYKLDRYDYMGQLLQVGHDVVGAVTVKEAS